MKALVLRELKSVFCSSAGAFFALAFLLVTGVMLWAFSGSYNFVDKGYANLDVFFSLTPTLFIILVPALTMRLFAEEKRIQSLDILKSRPVTALNIYLSKFIATLIFILVTLLPTLIYVVSLFQLANPVGNIDIGSIAVSYISLTLLTMVFITLGLFGSVITSNQVVAFISSVFISLFIFYGFDLLASLFLSGKTQSILSSMGLLYHYKLMQHGVIQIKDLLVIINYLILFSAATLLFLNKNKKRTVLSSILILFTLNILFLFIPNIRFDFTADKRYTLDDYTKSLLENVGDKQSINVNIYLNGDLNYGFQNLQNATKELLADFNKHANNNITVSYINPYKSGQDIATPYEFMSKAGMPGIMLNETDREGKASRKIIYPYAQVSNGKDTLVVSLLKNISGYTAEENLNASIESLEYEFADAIRLLNQQHPKSIAFIEGHKELPRTYVYDAEERLSKYYFVNRGQIGNEINILKDFSAIIIAGPLSKFNEAEKYVLDQYIMSGGKVLWLIDGVFYSHQDLIQKGYSASIKNDVNLDDMLFCYGIRVNPDLIQDKQCVSTYLFADNNVQSATLLPSFYQPLLIPSPNHVVTKNMRDVKAGFASSIDIVNNTPDIKKDVLLISSENTHLVKVPEVIDFDVESIQNQPDYFNLSYIPVAVSLEGKFNSAFANRMIPGSINIGSYKTINQSKETKMIVVSSSDIISNEIEGQGQNSQVLPMGYDRASRQQFGNPDFIVNAINWLTDDDGLTALRNKQHQLYILNKNAAYENRDKYAILNIGLPLLFVALIMGSTFLYRKRKYEK